MTIQPPRINGWLLAPLAWLLMSLISSSIAVIIYLMMMISPQTHQLMSAQGPNMVIMPPSAY